MIFGIGTDLVRQDRIQQSLDRFGDRFVRRLLLQQELEAFHKQRNPTRFLAMRFAAKEAVVKALSGSGGRGSFWLDIEIRNEQDGRPVIELDGRAREMADALGVRRVFVSLTHTRELAAASVLLEG